MWPRDLVLEAYAGIFARPGRMVLTILGTMIGLAALVATLGLSRTASNQIIGRFDELPPPKSPSRSLRCRGGGAANELPWDSAERIQRLNGVVAVGTMSEVDVDGELVSGSPFTDPRRAVPSSSWRSKRPHRICSPAVRARLRIRAGSRTGALARRDKVAVLGAERRRAARDQPGRAPAVDQHRRRDLRCSSGSWKGWSASTRS